MSSGQKAAFSVLTALVLFAGFVFFAQTGLMAQIETKFYAQAKIAEKDNQLETISERCNSYISDILAKIQTDDEAYLKSSAVKTYVHQNPSEKDATERKNLTARLFDELEDYGLDGIRIIEKNGRTLHYSSYESDVLKRVSLSTTYKLYTDVIKDSEELAENIILVDSEKPETKLLLDNARDRIIISFPFYITDNTYFATCVCYFDINKFEQTALDERHVSLGEGLTAIANEDSFDGGFVLGLPKNGKSEFYSPVLTSWNKNKKNSELGLERILQKDDGSYWLLMTSPLSKYFKVSAVYSSALFELPRELEYLIYISVYMTLLLDSALLFNLKRDYLSIIKSRIKKVQFGIINEYLENKEKIEWAQIARQLETRKAELSEEIKKSIGAKSKRYSKQVDAYLDSSWEDIIGILKAQNSSEATLGGATIEEIRRVIEDVLKNSKLNVNVAVPSAVAAPEVVEAVEEIEEAEEVEALDEVEPVEEIEEVEEVESLEDAEPVEEIEEVEEVEALDEAEPVDEIEEIEEVEALDDAEPVEKIEEVEEVESLEDAEPVEEIEEVEEVETLDDAEPVEDIEEVEALDDAEPVEEIEEAEPGEEIEEVEALDEAEPVEEIEEVEEVEEIEELEELEEISPVDQTHDESINSYGSNIKLPPFIDNDDPRFHEEFFVGHQPEEKYTNIVNNIAVYEFETPAFVLQKKSDQEEVLEPIPEPEEILDAEEIPEQPYFSMTTFGQNEQPVIELKGDFDDNASHTTINTIIERNGVYSIADNLSYSMVVQNADFKSLVDSVLQN